MFKNSPYSVRLASVLISIYLVLLGLYYLQDLLILIAFALILAMVLLPLCRGLENKGFPRSLAISIGLLFSVAIIVGLISLLFFQIIEFSNDWPIFIKKTEKWISGLQTFLSRNLNISRKKQMLELSSQSIGLLKNSGSILTATFSTIVHSLTILILIPIFMFFMLYYRSFFFTFLVKVFPTTEKDTLRGIMGKTGSVVQGYLVGLLFVMFTVAGANSLGFWWIGIDYPIFFGIMTGLLLLIPYIGIWIGASLPILLSLATLSPSHALAIIVWIATVQFIEANFVTPLVIGSKVSINPLVAMLALLGGEMLWGIPGLILALPFTAIIKVIFDHVPTLQPYGFILGEAPKRVKETEVL
jgi:predicted PurR-regulated permease PerM